jgi:hypothetical protein
MVGYVDSLDLPFANDGRRIVHLVPGAWEHAEEHD